MLNNHLFLSKKPKYFSKNPAEIDQIREIIWWADHLITFVFVLYVNSSFYIYFSLLCGFPSKEVEGKLFSCSELSMSSFRATVICQFPLLFAKSTLEVPFLGIGSKWHQLPSAKLHSSSSPLMTEKWNGTFNYCPCALGWDLLWRTKKNK